MDLNHKIKWGLVAGLILFVLIGHEWTEAGGNPDAFSASTAFGMVATLAFLYGLGRLVWWLISLWLMPPDKR